MKAPHWLGLVVVIAIAYYAGTKGFLGMVKNAVTGTA
jgi:hypothetical protein